MANKKYLDYEGLQELVEKIEEKYAPIQAVQYKGSVATISNLPTVANTAVGSMYNVITGGETTADFVVDEQGKILRDGANVVAVNTGTDADPIMKWDVVAGLFDLSDRLQFGTTMPTSPQPESGDTFLYLGETTYTYDAVTPEGTENPVDEGWYEYNATDDIYELSEDTTVQTGTSYFAKNEQYVKGVIYVYSGSAWVAQSSGDTYIAITKAEIDALFD